MRSKLGIEARRQLVALLSMSLGSFGVFYLIYVMNGDKGPPPAEPKEKSAAFQVEQRKPPPKQKPKPQPKAKPKRSTSSAAPAPNLGPGLRGASFDLPGFSASDMGAAGESLLGDTQKKMAMTEGAVDVVPKPQRRVQPEYPQRARERGETGYVRMSIFVDEDGRVGTVKVLEAKPRGIFEEAAKTAVEAWEFQPGQYDGQAVGTWVTQTVRFELKKS